MKKNENGKATTNTTTTTKATTTTKKVKGEKTMKKNEVVKGMQKDTCYNVIAKMTYSELNKKQKEIFSFIATNYKNGDVCTVNKIKKDFSKWNNKNNTIKNENYINTKDIVKVCFNFYVENVDNENIKNFPCVVVNNSVETFQFLTREKITEKKIFEVKEKGKEKSILEQILQLAAKGKKENSLDFDLLLTELTELKNKSIEDLIEE